MFRLYAALSKARLSALVLLTTASGFLLASQDAFDWKRFSWTLMGTTLAALGANALNQCMEAERDSRMERTRKRPLPAGKLAPLHALTFALFFGTAGPLLLFFRVNALTALLCLASELVYLLIYTPLKTRSTACTLVGALCGALPPMMGWTAATGNLGLGAWILGALLFVWQIPHFLALAWLYRDDYAKGGFRMLTVFDRSGRASASLIALYGLALLPMGLAATLGGLAGWRYAIASLALGAGFFALSMKLYLKRSLANARLLFRASLVYLPLLFWTMALDRGPSAAFPPVSSAQRVVALAAAPSPQAKTLAFPASNTPRP